MRISNLRAMLAAGISPPRAHGQSLGKVLFQLRTGKASDVTVQLVPGHGESFVWRSVLIAVPYAMHLSLNLKRREYPFPLWQ